MVNHKDGNKINNALINLEWATCLENNIHKINAGLSNTTKKVIQFNDNINTYEEEKIESNLEVKESSNIEDLPTSNIGSDI